MDFRSVIEKNRESYLDELFEVLEQKSISAQNEGIRECAELMMEKLKSAGIEHVELMETEIHPVVYGEYHVSDDAPT
ncbi:deacylase, partial [Planococcus sp. SIMBA_143]